MKRLLSHCGVFAIVVAGTLGLSCIAQAWPIEGITMPYPGGGYNVVHLTPEQREKAQQFNAGYAAATEQPRQELFSKQAQLGIQVYATEPSAKKIEALSGEIGVLRGKLLVEKLRFEAVMKKEGIPYKEEYGHRGPVYGYGHGRGSHTSGCGAY